MTTTADYSPRKKGPAMIRFRLLALLIVPRSAVLPAGTAAASPPSHFVQASDEAGTFAVDCGSFEASVTGT